MKWKAAFKSIIHPVYRVPETVQTKNNTVAL